ncbi:argininosuccinate lyase [bacterium]|nr:argininosuccinate lyase [bacterium]
MIASNRTKTGKSKIPGKAWEGRFTKPADPRAEDYTSSLAVDFRLLEYDIRGSIAHTRMLVQCRILTPGEGRRILKGLDQVFKEWKAGRLEACRQDEDVHMLVERRLHEIIGAVAGKLHTARSRNDQVVTDLKLYLRHEVAKIVQGLSGVQQVLLKLAERHIQWIMPGYTHLQSAQPVLVSHWLLAHLEAFSRDEKRFQQLLKGSLDELPLGAAALAGTGHPIDRKMTAKLLGFSRVTANSMDTVGDRDFGLEVLSSAAICGVHLSRLAEELVIFSSVEYNFLTLDQGFATGSSIMPQKRNPDIAELLRGRSGRLNGNLVTLLTVLKGLPLTYNRDLQEDKEPVFDSVDTLKQSFFILPPMLASLRFNQTRMEQACGRGFPNATEAADHLVRQGVPFREAHAVVGRVVTAVAQKGLGLENLSLAEWRKFHPAFQPGIIQDVKLSRAVGAKSSQGGTSPARVRAVVAQHRRRLFKRKTIKSK